MAELKQKWTFCIYCGGTTVGTTVDHAPPIAVFDNRQRPKGFEFLACAPCNHGSRDADQFAGLISRMLSVNDKPNDSMEITRALRGLENNYPHLLRDIMQDEVQPFARVRLEDGNIRNIRRIRLVGSAAIKILQKFSHKIAIALHTEAVQRILPLNGTVFARWVSNYDAMSGYIPNEFIDLLGPVVTLKQGIQSVEDQFSYRSGFSRSAGISAHAAVFRRSFCIVAFVSETSADTDDLNPTYVRHPGLLKT